jgi:hypothetical protein
VWIACTATIKSCSTIQIPLAPPQPPPTIKYPPLPSMASSVPIDLVRDIFTEAFNAFRLDIGTRLGALERRLAHLENQGPSVDSDESMCPGSPMLSRTGGRQTSSPPN